MQVFLCITIDTEPDCSPSWHYSTPLAFSAVEEGVGNKLHPLFLEFGIQPTYLINNVVLEDDKSVAVLKGLKGDYELGTHLHGDFIEPGKIYADYAGKDGAMNQCFLDPETEYGKLKNITELFTRQFGYAPVSFRAGRFSAGNNTMHSLADLGYKVDTSVTPRIVWKDASRERPVDFTQTPDQPYWTDRATFPLPSDRKSILQVPVSITTTRKYGIFKRPLWLRPHYSDAQQLISVAKDFIRRYHNRPVVVLNMMFHNVEVMPALNPYTMTDKNVSVYLDSMKKFFEYCSGLQIKPATLATVYRTYSH